MIAYIFATCVPGEEKDTISKIKKLPNVVEVNGIMGRYDLFVKVSGQTELDLHSAITSIRDIASITSTATYTALRGQGGTIDDE